MSGMEGKLLEKISTLEDSMGAHVANIAARLDVLEGQPLSNLSMVRVCVVFENITGFHPSSYFLFNKRVKQTVKKLYQHVTVYKILKQVSYFFLRSSLTS